MDAGNQLRREGAASLGSALKKMPQLTSLDLEGALIRFGRGLGGWASGPLVGAVGYALGCDVVWFGYALEGVRQFARCVLRGGRRLMQAMGSGVRGRHRWGRCSRRCRSSPRSASEVRGFALGEAFGGLGGPGRWWVLLGTRLDAMWCG
jgi:hypothetical protein